MDANRSSFELFSLPGGVAGAPEQLSPASFVAMGALELQDIERWIRERPLLLGEELKIVTHQFASFERTKDRLDILAIDREGRLVVIEVKRDTSGSSQDLQALRYAALVSTFRALTLADVHAEYVSQNEGRQIDPEQAREELEAFIEGGDLDVVDEELKPRIMLVAAGFQSAVTTTVIWLTRAYDMDITCVQLVPYEVGDQVVLGSSILLPLPEAGDYEDRVAEKQRAATRRKATVAPLDHDRARAFIAAIPTGRWAAYIDVAVAGGSPKGAMGVGAWLKSDIDIPHVYRVLNRSGEVNPGYAATDPGLPPDPAAVRERLASEGVSFTEDGRASQEQRWTASDWSEGDAG